MNRDFVYQGLLRRGYAPHIAEGIVWNFQDESSFNPRAVGDNGNAIGLAQWNGPRKRSLEQWAATNGRDHWDPETQLDYLDYELKGPESGAFKKLQGAQTPAEAAIAFNTHFERPAEENLRKRNAKYASQGGLPGDVSFGPVKGSPEPMAFLSQGRGEGDPAAGIYSDPTVQAQYIEPEDEPMKYQKWLREKMPWIGKRDNRDTLLAIGAGLLSGDDWASGGAAAAENVLALRKERRGRDEDRLDSAADFARAQQQASDPSNVKKYRVGNVRMPDGSYRSDLSHGTDGRIYDGAGNPIDPELAAQIMEVNNSDAYGTKGQMGFGDAIKAQQRINTAKSGLETIDRIDAYLANDPAQGFQKLYEQGERAFRTLIGAGLTEDQIAAAVASGDQIALGGMVREARLGPGPMTEQDFQNLIISMGGRISSVFAHPDTLKEALGNTRTILQRQYDQDYRQYEATRLAFPQTGFVPIEPYVPLSQRTQTPEVTATPLPPPPDAPALSGLGEDDETETILKKYGI